MNRYKTKWVLLGLICLAAYIPLFMTVSSLTKKEWNARIKLSMDHLLYVLEQGDDMALIDWGKILEKEDDVSAFRLTVGSKIFAEGGNLKYLLSQSGPGFISKIQPRGGKEDVKLEMVYQNVEPGILLWGFLSVLLCLLAALVADSRFFRTNEPGPIALQESFSPKPMVSDLGGPAVPSPPGQTGALVFVDHGLLIRQVSEKAAQLFGMSASTLLHTHLLDLEPSPALLEALSEKREIGLDKAFLPNLGISAFLKPDSNGTFLYLKVPPEEKDA